MTETAEAGLDGILEYISTGLHNTEAAAAFMDELENKIDETRKIFDARQIM